MDDGLIGHWRLDGDSHDESGRGLHGQSHGVDFSGAGPRGRGRAARPRRPDGAIVVPHADALDLGGGDFSIAVWVDASTADTDAPGDVVAKYDPAARRGFNLGMLSKPGVASHQPNHRHLHFGVDDGAAAAVWADCGRPGRNVFVCALAVHEGELYAGTFEPGAEDAGHVYRYAGGAEWLDCGSPDRANAVTALAAFEGELYAGTSRYRAQGSALPESPNQHPGGRVYRYAGGDRWLDSGKPDQDDRVARTAEFRGDPRSKGAPVYRSSVSDSIAGLTVYGGRLYTTPLYSQGVFRYEGEGRWSFCGEPGRRLLALGVYDGGLYAAGSEGGGVWRYDGGTGWTDCGSLAETTQVYSFAVLEGKLHVGTWPGGTVFRYEGGETWSSCGRLGAEEEVMGMVVYNGKLYAGTLPQAEVYRYDGGAGWSSVGRLDWTPDVRFRRAWSMAVYQGKLFCGTLPSGHVHALEVGHNVTHDHELGSGWRHLAAVRAGGQLRLYVDGRLAAASTGRDRAALDVSNDAPLRIGSGQQARFDGAIADLRLYRRALADDEVAALFEAP